MRDFDYSTFFGTEPPPLDPIQQDVLMKHLASLMENAPAPQAGRQSGVMPPSGGGQAWGRRAANNAVDLLKMANKGNTAPSGFSGTGDGLDAAGNEVAGMASSGEAAGAGKSALTY